MRKTFLDGIMLLIIAGAILAWVNINHINSTTSFINYFRHLSTKAQKCVGSGRHPYAHCFNYNNIGGGNGSSAITQGANGKPNKISQSQVHTNEVSLTKVTSGTPSTNAKYAPAQWQHWLGSPCDVGDQVLINQGKKIKLSPQNKCDILSGSWVSPYDGKKITNPSGVSIDSIVPIQYAVKNGGNSWTAAKKQQFANDSSQLVAVSNQSYRAKDFRFPDQWMPSNHSYDCEYSIIWTKVLQKYKLGINASNMKVLTNGLKSCR
jgi:hypothetical protein